MDSVLEKLPITRDNETRLGSEWTLETNVLAPEPTATRLFCQNCAWS